MTWRWFDCMTNTYHNIKDEEEMTLTEQVFRKMGWLYADKYWSHPDSDIYCEDKVPPISSSWEVCAKWLVPFMGDNGYQYDIWTVAKSIKIYYFRWDTQNTPTEIKDDNIAEAACKAFMEVEL